MTKKILLCMPNHYWPIQIGFCICLVMPSIFSFCNTFVGRTFSMGFIATTRADEVQKISSPSSCLSLTNNIPKSQSSSLFLHFFLQKEIETNFFNEQSRFGVYYI